MDDLQRLLIDLYQFCDVLDFDYVDEKPDYESFYDLLNNIKRNTVVDTKRSISHDLRGIMREYAEKISKMNK